MEVELTQKAKKDLLYWKSIGKSDILKRIRVLVESIQEVPFSGIGKPEPLKYQLAGKWSRRINDEHRIIYSIVDNTIYIHSLKEHYK